MASLVSVLKRKLASLLAAPPSSPGNLLGSASTSGGVDAPSANPPRPRKRRRLESEEAGGGGGIALAGPPRRWPSAPSLVGESFPRDDTVEADDGSLSASPRDEGADREAVGDVDRPSSRLMDLPRDVLLRCLTYASAPSDRFGLQVACRGLRELSNSEEMLAGMELCGGRWGEVCDDGDFFSPRPGGADGGHGPLAAALGLGQGGVDNDGDSALGTAARPAELTPLGGAGGGGRGIVLEDDTSAAACERLARFVAAGNRQATYMMGMIQCYCHENIPEGLALLRCNASQAPSTRRGRCSGLGPVAALPPHAPSAYALALILRDSCRAESDVYLDLAASLGHLPAWQEKLTASAMRARFGGDVDASVLERHLDPPCLGRLLGRHHVRGEGGGRAKGKRPTSHCWNPLCGRWAYKALRGTDTMAQQQQLRRALWDRRRAWPQGFRRLAMGDMGRILAAIDLFEPANASDVGEGVGERAATGNGNVDSKSCRALPYSIESLLPCPNPFTDDSTPLARLRTALREERAQWGERDGPLPSRMKMCSSCRRAKYCSKLCQVYDWRSGRHKAECQYL
ncbi:hypothetical protein ACHAWF_016367 [Thalassiosira exigua]